MHVVPSDIVAYIDRAFPGQGYDAVSAQHAGTLKAIADLVGELDGAHLPIGEDLVKLYAGISALKSKLASWEGRDPRGATDRLGRLTGYDQSPIAAVRDVLITMPDQATPPEISGLDIIDDKDLREDLRSDVASVGDLLHAGQWKAAMVLAGGVIEALLLNALQKHDDQDGITQVAREKRIRNAQDVTRWLLADYVQVAAALGIISQTCQTAADLARDARNLIHPGKKERQGRKASRANAISCQAGMEHVIEELTASQASE